MHHAHVPIDGLAKINIHTYSPIYPLFTPLLSLFLFIQMYKISGTLVHLSMSADASCRGLVNPRNGPVVMELTQGMYNDVGWPDDVQGRIIYTTCIRQSVFSCSWQACNWILSLTRRQTTYVPTNHLLIIGFILKPVSLRCMFYRVSIV